MKKKVIITVIVFFVMAVCNDELVSSVALLGLTPMWFGRVVVEVLKHG